jgi:hypothetical protein
MASSMYELIRFHCAKNHIMTMFQQLIYPLCVVPSVVERAANIQGASPIFENVHKGKPLRLRCKNAYNRFGTADDSGSSAFAYLSLEEEFNGTCRCHPGLQLQLAQTVLVRDKYFADHETNCQEEIDSDRPEGVHPNLWLVGLGREGPRADQNMLKSNQNKQAAHIT